MTARSYYEFFAGGGMASTALSARAGEGWTCLFANDFDDKKARSFRANHPSTTLSTAPIEALSIDDLPKAGEDGLDLCWASFPCQDLSLAGGGAGLDGARSGAFWAFERLMASLRAAGRAPRLIVLENVIGAATRSGGRNLAVLGRSLAGLGYRAGPLILDAVHFTPQSRPRLFVVAVRDDISIPTGLLARDPCVFAADAEEREGDDFLSWQLPPVPIRNNALEDVLEPDGKVVWAPLEATARLLSLMDERHQAKVAAAREKALRRGRPVVGTVFRRTRSDGQGGRVQRAEVRFDGVAGCLRTPAGGSSRQTLLRVGADNISSRLLTPREGARLMGLPEEYQLPAKAADAYRLLGDGVAPPVVEFLARTLLEPILDGSGVAVTASGNMSAVIAS